MRHDSVLHDFFDSLILLFLWVILASGCIGVVSSVYDGAWGTAVAGVAAVGVWMKIGYDWFKSSVRDPAAM